MAQNSATVERQLLAPCQAEEDLVHYPNEAKAGVHKQLGYSGDDIGGVVTLDFVNHIYLAGLEAVKPEVVNIIK